jgi:hypothetical protein
MERPITLQFRSLDDLWAFRIAALITVVEMDQVHITLTCTCSKAAMDLAVSQYKASVILAAKVCE